MTDKLKQIIKNELATLPKEAQEIVNFSDWASITEEIGKKNLLNESEVNDLVVQTLLVLVGLKDMDFYATSVENEVGTTKDEAEKITTEAIEKVFMPIAEKLEGNIKKNLQNKNPSWDQNLNFVLSGGDYSAFAEPRPDKVGQGGFN